MYIIETVDKLGVFDGGFVVKTAFNAMFYYNRQKKLNPNAQSIVLKELNTNKIVAKYGK